ncbi:class I SAM-dependent methyltransferase [Chloroflexota bacterium]
MPVVFKEKWDTLEQYLEYLRHLAAYAVLAEPLVANKKVLEIGCGSGYGANYLSESALSVVATDISPKGIADCRNKYGRENLDFMEANGLKLPFKNSSFDVAVSFQVIEHLTPKSALKYLSEIRRVLNSEGVFLVSTPNSRLRLLPFQKPWNPEHKKEYKEEDLKELLGHVFEDVKVYGLRASDKLQATGYGRLKNSPWKTYHSPWQAYIQLPVYRILNNHLPLPIRNWLKKVKQSFFRPVNDYKLTPQVPFISKYSPNDFIIEPSCPKYCLDLYGICRKM